MADGTGADGTGAEVTGSSASAAASVSPGPPRLMRHQVGSACRVSVEQVMYIYSDFTSHLRLQSHRLGINGYRTPILTRTLITLVLFPPPDTKHWGDDLCFYD